MVFLERLRQPLVCAVLGLSLCVGLLAFSFTYAKYHALGFNAIDYSFYIQSVATLADPSALQQVRINPNGHNAFRFEGVEAVRSVNQAIHFEPVKYIEATLYHFFPSPIAIFIFIILVCLAPALYLAAIAPLGTHREQKIFVSVALLYLLQPLLIFSVANDLRPLTLLTPLFFAAFLSIWYKRPLWERFAWLGALLLVREEAVVLLPALVAFNWSQCYREVGRVPARKQTLPLALLWCVGTLATGFYYAWASYAFALSKTLSLHPWILPAVLILLALGGFVVFFFWKFMLWYGQIISLVALAGIIGAELWVALGVSWGERLHGLFFHPFSWLGCALMLCVGMYLTEFRTSATRAHNSVLPRRYAFVPFVLCIGIGALYMIGWFVGPSSVYASWYMYVQQAHATQLVWDAAEKTSHVPKSASTLVDLATLQAFYSAGTDAYAFERLPVYLAGVSGRYYPTNTALLEQMLKTQIRSVVVANPDVAPLQALAQAAGKKLIPLLHNSHYSFWSVQ